MTIYRLQMQNEYDIIKIEEQPCERVAWPSFYREWRWCTWRTNSVLMIWCSSEFFWSHYWLSFTWWVISLHRKTTLKLWRAGVDFLLFLKIDLHNRFKSDVLIENKGRYLFDFSLSLLFEYNITPNISTVNRWVLILTKT